MATTAAAAAAAAAAAPPPPPPPPPARFADVGSRVAALWRHPPAEPADLSFREIAAPADLLAEPPRPARPAAELAALRLANNLLASIADLPRCIDHIVRAADLTWLDVSFNALRAIDPCLLAMPNLRVLYLHANRIESIAETDKLGLLAHLRNLTLHGNPLESAKAYRFTVLARVPQLRHLDFCAITKQDRVVARTLLDRQSRLKHAADDAA